MRMKNRRNKLVGTTIASALSFGLSSYAAGYENVVTESGRTYFPSAFVNVSPLGMLIGTFEGEVGFGLNEEWSLGLTGNYRNSKIGDEGFDGSGLGVLTYYHFNSPVMNSPFVKMSVERGYLHIASKEKDHRKVGTSDIDYDQVKLLAGYHWIWRNGVTLNLGGGFNYLNATSHANGESSVRVGGFKTKIAENYSGIIPTAELSVGVQFLR